MLIEEANKTIRIIIGYLDELQIQTKAESFEALATVTDVSSVTFHRRIQERNNAKSCANRVWFNSSQIELISKYFESMVSGKTHGLIEFINDFRSCCNLAPLIDNGAGNKHLHDSSFEEILYTKIQKAGIVDLLFGRQELQSNGYNTVDLIKSLSEGDSIYVFARSAKAFGSHYKLIREKINTENVNFVFALGDPNIESYDKFGQTDLPIVLDFLSSNIQSSNLKIFLLPVFLAYSFIIIEKPNSEKFCILDLFVDLPYEYRHNLILKSTNASISLFVDALVDLKDFYLGKSRPYERSGC